MLLGMTFTDSIPDLDALVKAVEDRSTNLASTLHGPEHWRHVGKAAYRLLLTEPEADPAVAFLFALFHDSMRENDDVDPDHGSRARSLIWQLGQDVRPGLWHLSPLQYTKLLYACHRHTEGEAMPDPVIGVCWDADRLNLWRVGIYPDPQYLSTAEASRPETIGWASDEVWDVPPTWHDLYLLYSAL